MNPKITVLIKHPKHLVLIILSYKSSKTSMKTTQNVLSHYLLDKKSLFNAVKINSNECHPNSTTRMNYRSSD